MTEEHNNLSLSDQYHRLLTNHSDIVDHLPTFVQQIKDLNATKVIELGVRFGVSTIAFLHGLEATNGHLWSVDGDIPFSDWEDDTDLLGQYLDGSSSTLDNWTFIHMWDTDPTLLELLPHDVDILFIDTSHIYAETLRELTTFTSFVRPGGLILLHDTEVDPIEGENVEGPVKPEGDQPHFPVFIAISEFCEHNALMWKNDHRCNGLGTIYL